MVIVVSVLVLYVDMEVLLHRGQIGAIEDMRVVSPGRRGVGLSDIDPSVGHMFPTKGLSKGAVVHKGVVLVSVARSGRCTCCDTLLEQLLEPAYYAV